MITDRILSLVSKVSNGNLIPTEEKKMFIKKSKVKIEFRALLHPSHFTLPIRLIIRVWLLQCTVVMVKCHLVMYYLRSNG